jgi:hypothetical protein
MRWYLFLCSSLTVALFTSCEPEDNDTKPAVNPTIVFRSDSGYTFQSDTIGLSDTVRVGVIIEKGTDAMHHFKVSVSYDGNVPEVTDSLPLGVEQFEFEKLMIARSQAGIEKWSFGVTENDGDVIRRTLTLTVQ